MLTPRNRVNLNQIQFSKEYIWKLSLWAGMFLFFVFSSINVCIISMFYSVSKVFAISYWLVYVLYELSAYFLNFVMKWFIQKLYHIFLQLMGKKQTYVFVQKYAQIICKKQRRNQVHLFCNNLSKFMLYLWVFRIMWLNFDPTCADFE